MSTNTHLRIIPRDSDFLDRKLGSRGEVFFDQTTNTLRLYDGQTQGGLKLARGDLSNVTNANFLSKSIAAGVSGGNFEFMIAGDDSTARTVSSGNTIQFNGGAGISTTTDADGGVTITNTNSGFSNIVVSGQSTVVADAINDSFTLVAGANVTLTTDASTDSITIAATSTASNSFSTIVVAGQSNVVAETTTDTLTVVAGSGISITTDATTDTITIANTTSAANLSQLTDATTASLTVDKIYLPAITRLDVTNIGTTAYRFDQYGATNNPSVYAISGTTMAFNLNVIGHAFLIQDSLAANYNTGLVHVTTTGTVTTGAAAQGKTSGTLYWKIPDSISGTYRYQSGDDIAMVGSIIVKGFNAI